MNSTPQAQPLAATHPLTLQFVGRPNLQAEILGQYLSQALQTTCEYAYRADESTRANGNSLLLFDCKNLSLDEAYAHLETLHQQSPAARVVLFNVTPNSNFEQMIHWPCVKGIFFDDCSQQIFLKGMRAILDGEIWLPRRLLEDVFEHQRSSMPLPARSDVKLSRRECDILRLISMACSNVTIASRLHISEHTVKSHLYNIFRKLGVHNRTEASHWAMSHLASLGE